MKYLAQFLFASILIFSSCSKDENVIEPITYEATDYIGTWNGALECTDGDNETITIIISETVTENKLKVDFGDEAVFTADISTGKLVIEAQTINFDQEFDVVTMAGEGELENIDKLMLSIDHIVDEESRSCTLALNKL